MRTHRVDAAAHNIQFGTGHRYAGQHGSTTLPKANAIAIDDPQFAGRVPASQCRRQTPKVNEHRALVLAFDP
jgi:hypothetical protein